MELKEFIKSTVTALIEATEELQSESRQVSTVYFVNPSSPSAKPGADAIYSPAQRVAPVTVIGFDIAVTEGSSKSAKGGGTVNVALFKADGSGDVRTALENVSRVKFEYRVALPVDDEAPVTR